MPFARSTPILISMCTTSSMKGCFYKSTVAYFGLGGTVEEMSSSSRGQKIRSEYTAPKMVGLFTMLLHWY